MSFPCSLKWNLTFLSCWECDPTSSVSAILEFKGHTFKGHQKKDFSGNESQRSCHAQQCREHAAGVFAFLAIYFLYW